MVLKTVKISDRYCLMCEVYSQSNQQLLYSLDLANLSSSEEKLNEGRFKHYTRDVAFVNNIHIPWNNIKMEYAEYRRKLWNILNWIGEHIETPWSLSIESTNVIHLVAKFSFESASAAVLFGLVWI